jgi:peptidoglycan/xylan/chitin deacetylase (PgdA/CDA1 family)
MQGGGRTVKAIVAALSPIVRKLECPRVGAEAVADPSTDACGHVEQETWSRCRTPSSAEFEPTVPLEPGSPAEGAQVQGIRVAQQLATELPGSLAFCRSRAMARQHVVAHHMHHRDLPRLGPERRRPTRRRRRLRAASCRPASSGFRPPIPAKASTRDQLTSGNPGAPTAPDPNGGHLGSRLCVPFGEMPPIGRYGKYAQLNAGRRLPSISAADGLTAF